MFLLYFYCISIVSGCFFGCFFRSVSSAQPHLELLPRGDGLGVFIFTRVAGHDFVPRLGVASCGPKNPFETTSSSVVMVKKLHICLDLRLFGSILVRSPFFFAIICGKFQTSPAATDPIDRFRIWGPRTIRFLHLCEGDPARLLGARRLKAPTWKNRKMFGMLNHGFWLL